MTGDANGEDVLQDALLRALRAYPRLRHAEHLRAWLYRVTTTTALDHQRARRREVLTAAPPAAVAEPEHYDDAFDVADRGAAGPARRPRCGCASSRTSTTRASPPASAAPSWRRASASRPPIRTLRTQGIPA